MDASLSGFQTVVRKGIRLAVGTQSVVDFTLGPSAVQETVTVAGGRRSWTRCPSRSAR